MGARAPGERIVRISFVDQLVRRKLYGSTDLPPLWIDGAIKTVREQVLVFFQRYKVAGGDVDELVQDSELFTFGAPQDTGSID